MTVVDEAFREDSQKTARRWSSTQDPQNLYSGSYGPNDLLVFHSPDQEGAQENIHAFKIGYWNPYLNLLKPKDDSPEYLEGLLESLRISRGPKG